MNQLEELKGNKDIVIHEAPGMLASVIYLNNQKAPLDNVKFRQALSYATDYNGIIEGAVKGHGEQLTTPVPKGMWGRDDNAAGYTYDVNKAKELLSQSGVPEGTQLTLLYSDNQPFNETQALLLQNNFKAIGIDLKLEKTAWPTFRERVDKGDFELGMGTWSPDYADPQNYMSYWFDSGYFGLAETALSTRTIRWTRSSGKRNPPATTSAASTCTSRPSSLSSLTRRTSSFSRRTP